MTASSARRCARLRMLEKASDMHVHAERRMIGAGSWTHCTTPRTTFVGNAVELNRAAPLGLGVTLSSSRVRRVASCAKGQFFGFCSGERFRFSPDHAFL